MPFHKGNKDGKHYWLTPPDLMAALQAEFGFDFDACPYPKPDDFDGLSLDWGSSTYVNPPFGTVMHEGKKKGVTAWARKAIAEHAKGKDVVLVFPTDKWIHYLLRAGAELRSLGDVRWHAIEDGSRGGGIGRFTMAFILRGEKTMKPNGQSHYLIQFFKYEHLPESLREVSKPFCELAQKMEIELPENPEHTTMLRKLLEAKDCAVRALLFKEEPK